MNELCKMVYKKHEAFDPVKPQVAYVGTGQIPTKYLCAHVVFQGEGAPIIQTVNYARRLRCIEYGSPMKSG